MDTIIIGAGASGLVCAIELARKGMKVRLLEQNKKVGKKILISGNGKCNITNRMITPKRFYSQNFSFVQEVLKGYSYEVIEDFFRSIGLPLIEKKENKIFPLSLQALSVVDILEYEARKLGVEIECNTQVTQIEKKENGFMVTAYFKKYASKNLIIASGSLAYPQLGGSSFGYDFASQMGHTIIPTYPSLVQLCSDEKWIKEVSGVKINGVVKLYANKTYICEKKGDLLFTSYGISGLAILDISREVSLRIANFEYCELSLDIFPHMSREKLIEFLLHRIDKKSEKPIGLWLQGIVHKKLVATLIEKSKLLAKKESDLTKKEIHKIVYLLKNLKLMVKNTKGFKYAEVATGGIDTLEINSKTMESKLIPHLYFIGEVVDVDGDRGGFNFHFAWVSALRVAQNI